MQWPWIPDLSGLTADVLNALTPLADMVVDVHATVPTRMLWAGFFAGGLWVASITQAGWQGLVRWMERRGR